MKTLLPFALAVCMILTGCGGGSSHDAPPTPTLSSIRISTTSSIVPLGGAQSLSVTGTYSDGGTRDLTDKVTWTSSASNIATVSGLGDVTGVSLGTATITATKESLSDSIGLTVGPAALAQISLSPSAPSIPANTAQQLVALGRYTDGSTREVNDLVTWSSSDLTKATISEKGIATALSGGTLTVTAKAGDVSGSATMTVSTAQLVRIALLPYQPVTGLGVVQHFVALGTFDDYSTRELVSVSWNSSDTAVATIDVDGRATPLKSGSATITATSGTITHSTVLTVLPATLVSVTVTPATASIAEGTDQQFAATGLLNDGGVVDLPVVDWKSSDSAVAAVEGNGRTLGVTPGTVTISASAAGITGSSALSVSNARLQSVAVAPAVPLVPILALKQLYAVGKFSDGTAQDITAVATWWSNNSRVVTVSKNGLASTNATGSATITASLGSVLGSTALQVSSLTVDSVEVSPANAIVPKGVKVQYSLLSHLSDGSTTALDAPRWFTSPITMATASQRGLVTARLAGVGKIYGETCCKTGYTQLTVTSARGVSLAINPVSVSVPAGAVQPFKALATFDDGSVVDVSNAVHWTSSQPAVALLDWTGTATTMAAGSTQITATLGPVDGSSQAVTNTATFHVVAGGLTALTVTPGNVSISLGQSQQFVADGTFSDLSIHPVPGLLWESSDPAVAIVLPSGLVITTGQGTAVITATAGSIQASSTVTVP